MRRRTESRAVHALLDKTGSPGRGGAPCLRDADAVPPPPGRLAIVLVAILFACTSGSAGGECVHYPDYIHWVGRSFHIRGNPIPPEPFALLSPADGESLLTTEPTLIWESARDTDPGDSVRYTLYWSQHPKFGSSDSLMTASDTTHTFDPSILQPDQAYYWRVRAWDTYGLTRWSDPPGGWSFHITPVTPPDLNLQAVITNWGILVRWRIPEGLEAVACTVYRQVHGFVNWHVLSSFSPGEDRTVEYLDRDVEPGVRYLYEVEVVGPSGPEGRWGPAFAELPEVALWLGLSPNPGRETLTVEFGLPRSGRALLRLYDVGGREVARKETPVLYAGNHRVSWSPGNGQIRNLTSGAYWIRLDTAQGSRTARWTVIP